MKPVIILGCNTGGLAAIRSLGKRGIPVIAMTHNHDDVGVVSRYVHEVVWSPHASDENAFVNFLLNNAGRWGERPLLMESGDAYLTTLSRHKEKLSAHYTIASPDWHVASQFLEKRKTYQLAESAGVPYPWTLEPQSLSDIERVRDDIPFPCLIKPTLSHAFVQRFKTKVFIVNTYKELKDKLTLCFNEQFEVMVQEIIPGTDADFARVQVYFDREGNILGEFYNKKIRQSPPQFGQMRVGRSMPFDPRVSKYMRQLFSAVDYRGAFASIEFRRDTRDNSLKLMEVNIRLPRNVQLIINAGIDVPWLLYQDYILDHREVIESYDESVWIELLPDFLNVFARERDLLLRPVEFWRPYFSKGRTFGVFWLSDPKPFFKQVMSIPKRASREVSRVQNLGSAQTNHHTA